MRSIALTLSCMCSLIAMAAVPGGEFERLNRMRTASVTDLKPIQAQYLELAFRYTEPADLGSIYYHLVEDIYFQSGVPDPASAIQYGTKALEYPLSDSQHVQMEHVIGIAIERQNQGKKGEALAAARREIVRPLLDAAKYCLDRQIPDQEIPRVEDPFPFGRHNPRTLGPWLSDEENRKRETAWEEKKRQQDLKDKEYEDAVQRREEVNKSVDILIGCQDMVVSIYTKKPYDTDELRRMGMEIVGDEKTVESLVARVNAIIEQRGEKSDEGVTSATLVAATTPVETPQMLTPEPAPARTPQPSEVASPSHLWTSATVLWAALGVVGGLVIVAVVITKRAKR